MKFKSSFRHLTLALMGFLPLHGSADWNYSGGETPNAFIQAGNMTLELNCRGLRYIQIEADARIQTQADGSIVCSRIKADLDPLVATAAVGWKF